MLTSDTTEFAAGLADPNRSMLGDARDARLENRLRASTARWQVRVQQVLMARADVPAAVVGRALRRMPFRSARR